jgi:hypothetical protein
MVVVLPSPTGEKAMKKPLRKSLAAIAAVTALGGASVAKAADVPCFGMASFEQCYFGLVSTPAKHRAFSDFTIGSLSLGSLSNLVGMFLTPGIKLSEVSLWSGGTQSAVDSNIANGISFDSIASGDYSVHIAGRVNGPKFFGQRFGLYAGGFSVTPAVPEPETYALMLAGLLAICYVAKRRVSLGIVDGLPRRNWQPTQQQVFVVAENLRPGQTVLEPRHAGPAHALQQRRLGR